MTDSVILPKAEEASLQSEEQDDRRAIDRVCFVIMPFGEKVDMTQLAGTLKDAAAAGLTTTKQLPDTDDIGIIDFDEVYKKLIKPAVKAAEKAVDLDIRCIRSDETDHSGHIHHEMLNYVTSADIAIVDITTQNANVFYELGVRHSFRASTTILIRRKGTTIPFNISTMNAFDYDDDDTTPDAQGKTPLQISKEKLAHVIAASFESRYPDSLVHQLLPHLRVYREGWPIPDRLYVWSNLIGDKEARVMASGPGDKSEPKSVGYITGDILDIKDVDAWINLENTKMQMGRFHDGSISSNIRYYGAKLGNCGHVEYDTIAKELSVKMTGISCVEPGVVFATTAGELAERNNVKLLLHVAALQGEPGKGYLPIRDYPGCIRRALEEVDRHNAQLRDIINSDQKPGLFGRKRLAHEEAVKAAQAGLCRTVLIPLFGTKSFGHQPERVAEQLYRAALVYLKQNDKSLIHTIYYLAYTDQDRELCERALGTLERQKKLSPPSKAQTSRDQASAADRES